jgi:hypothetical protein
MDFTVVDCHLECSEGAGRIRVSLKAYTAEGAGGAEDCGNGDEDSMNTLRMLR